MNIHDDGAIFSNLGSYIQDDPDIDGHRLNGLSHGRLSGHSSGNEEDILISNPDDCFLVIEGGDGRTGENLNIPLFCNCLHDI